jgi:hypothetical protein
MKNGSMLAMAGLLAATTLGARPALADDTVVVPAANVTATSSTTEVNTPVIASGAITFGLFYGAAAVAAEMSDSGSPDRRMFVPVVGPWLDLSDQPTCPVGEQQCDRTTTRKILIGADGAMQAIGLVVAVYGILTPVHRTVDVVPVAMGHDGGHGLALTGHF